MNPDEYVVIDPKTITLVRNCFNKIEMTTAGNVTCNDVRFRAAFPMTNPGQCVVVGDGEENELGIIEECSALDPASAVLVTEELHAAALYTRIRSVDDVIANHGMTTWRLKTDRGDRTVYVKDRSDIRWFDDGKVVMTDINGLKYTVENVNNMDEMSRLRIEGEL